MGCNTCAVVVIGSVAGLVVIAGTFIIPAFLFSKYKHFDIEPVRFAGGYFYVSSCITLGVACFSVVSTLVYIIFLCIDKEFAAYFGGTAAFLAFLSLLFNVNLYLACEDSVEIVKARIENNIYWNISLPEDFGYTYHDGHGERKRVYRFDLRDWGHWYQDCSKETDNTTEIENCIAPVFTEQVNSYLKSGRKALYACCGTTLCFIFFLVNGKPKRTIQTFIMLCVPSSLIALPVCAIILYNTRYINLWAKVFKVDGNFVAVIWLSFLFCGGFILFYSMVHTGAINLLLGVIAFCLILEIPNVALIKRVSDEKNFGKLVRQWKQLTLVGIPHYLMLIALFVTTMIGLLYMAAKEAEDSYVVRVRRGERLIGMIWVYYNDELVEKIYIYAID